jgi:hypothetical protein
MFSSYFLLLKALGKFRVFLICVDILFWKYIYAFRLFQRLSARPVTMRQGALRRKNADCRANPDRDLRQSSATAELWQAVPWHGLSAIGVFIYFQLS